MNETPFSGRDLLAALLVIVVWGSNFVVMKVGLHDFSPFQMGAARYLFGALPLIFFVRRPRMAWKWIVLYGLFQGFGQFGLLFLSLRVGMTAALASVLMQTQMFFTALFAFLALRDKPGKPLIGGMILAALGLGCFAMNYSGPAGGAGGTTALGFLLCLAGASMWAVSNVIVRFAQKSAHGAFDPLGFLVWCCAVPILPFTAVSLLMDDPAQRWHWLGAPWSGWAAVAYLGWIATLLGYGLWTHLLKRYGPNRVAPFGLGVPVVGMSTGMLLLGETITTWQWAGIAFIVLALGCVVLGGRIGERLRPKLA